MPFVTCECFYRSQKSLCGRSKWQSLNFQLRKSCWYRLYKVIKAQQSQSKLEKSGKGFQTPVVKGPKQQIWKEGNNVDSVDRGHLHSSGSLPPIVSERMGRRMLYVSSVPFTLFVVFFVVVFVAKLQFDITLIPSLVAYSSLSLILFTMVALSYGIFSASWDVEQEGSFWGWNEFRVNIGRTLEGFKSNSSRK
ncbi:hypothetical protein GpartN1_g3920.t1 [Galdieria partita]|uniref:Uncharacterized protein n=1 Tax=Galdieria partita TaxID=83374 RepID=A0A9C7UQN3_9RHOD|nr:hypothetical protein GpartN1_g3920.t1 [Galdieria partita]